jgi:hypothetical protein
MRALAYIDLRARTLNGEQLHTWHDQGFNSVSLYVFESADLQALGSIADDVWTWLDEHRWLVSVNSRDEHWRAWLPVLERHDGLRLLVSHLGLPQKQANAPSLTEAQKLLAPVTALA